MNEENHEVHAPDISGEEMKMPEQTDTKNSETHSTAPLNGIIIVILILLLIFILGGLYYWFSQLMLQNNPATETLDTTSAVERPTTEANNEPESDTAEAAVETQQALSPSDELAAIEADLEATDFEAFDADLNAIDAELEAAVSQ